MSKRGSFESLPRKHCQVKRFREDSILFELDESHQISCNLRDKALASLRDILYQDLVKQQHGVLPGLELMLMYYSASTVITK